MTRNDVLELRHVRFARADYDQLMTRAINCIVSEEGVQNYVGSVPDYKNEKIDVIVRRPLADTTIQKLDERVGKGVVRIHDVRTAAMRPQPAGTANDTKKLMRIRKRTCPIRRSTIKRPMPPSMQLSAMP